ncbi:MAG TPA: hypothetical protein VN767_27795 [Streptosporangiaceae bacterium]|nr:hypothetical protein [Streptosporangiaceae bacterium]
MDLTADMVLGALELCTGRSATRPDEMVDLVRRTEPGLAVTLFSAWEAGGAGLSPALRLEVEAVRNRMEFYRAVIGRIRAKVPDLMLIKGLEVADLYPAGLVRNMTDIDVIAPSQSAQWDVVQILLAEGWEIDAGSAVSIDGDLHMLISLLLPHEDRYQAPYSAEIGTTYTLGNLTGIPPVLSLPPEWQPPAIKNMLMLLNERYEQPFRARDLIDSALLHEQLGDSDLQTLHEAVIELCLAVEYSELARLVKAAGLATFSPLPGGNRATAANARARRLTRQLGFARKPLGWAARNLQRRQIVGQTRRAENLVWGAVPRWMPVASAVEAGLLSFGLPVDGPPPDVSSVILRRRGVNAWVDTPVGRFLLTIGDDVPESLFDELSAPGDDTRKGGSHVPSSQEA